MKDLGEFLLLNQAPVIGMLKFIGFMDSISTEVKKDSNKMLARSLLRSAVMIFVVTILSALTAPSERDSHFDNAIVSLVQLAGHTESLDWQKSLVGSDLDVYTVQSPDPRVGRFLSLKSVDRISGRLVIDQATVGEYAVPFSRIRFIRNQQTNVDFRVRYNGLTRRFDLLRNDVLAEQTKEVTIQLSELVPAGTGGSFPVLL